jgi:hypothetical protein
MKRFRVAVAALATALVVCVTPSFGSAPGSASPSRATIQFNATLKGSYACLGPCATATDFTANGIANADTNSLGTMTYSVVGSVLDYDPLTNCLDQSEDWLLTTKNGHDGKDTIYLTTISNTLCFTADPNVSLETGTLNITGGTGRFAGATGSGTFTDTPLGHPQKSSGTLTATITY